VNCLDLAVVQDGLLAPTQDIDHVGHDDLRTTSRYFNLEERTKARQYYAAMERWRDRRN
jgi:hypothetical protein